MPDSPLTIAVLFGGRSAEHEVSLRSAASVYSAMDRSRYRVVPVLITRDGAWYRRPDEISSFSEQAYLPESERLIFSPDPAHRGLMRITSGGCLERIQCDVIFPVLHGTYGEDGTVQGLFDLANIPYVGCGVLASSVGMDKVLMKAVFRDKGLNVAPFFWFLRSDWRNKRPEIDERLKQSRFPVFVKPANLGSSVGITRVAKLAEFAAAVELAATYDRKILVEDGISGRELEVSVLGNDDPIASVPGEVIPHANFYDYEEKYLRNTTELIIPATLDPEPKSVARSVAVAAFKAVDGSGLARVDMFLTPEKQLYVNEINTLPGFTSVSMYPKLWEATGLPYERLVDRLVDLALERHRDKQSIITDRTE